MKKITNLLLTLGITAICLSGCSNVFSNTSNANDIIDNSTNVEISLGDVKYLATKWVNNSGSARAENPVEIEESLIGIMEDGTISTEILELPSNLEDDCKLNPVREVYKCDKGNDSTKGTYIVFDWYIDWWKDTDGNNVSLGQILFVGKDGKAFDIFNKNGDVKRIAHTYQKEYNGIEYIKFDNSGNAFIIGKEGVGTDSEREVIFKWNPITQELKTFELTGKSNVEIQEMDITSTGSWIFTQIKYNENGKDSGIYGFDVNGTGTPVAFYENTVQAGQWPITGMIVDNLDRLLFCISGFYAPGCQEGGIYIVYHDDNGLFSPNYTKRYYNLLWSDMYAYILSLIDNKNYVGNYTDYYKNPITVEKVQKAKIDYTKLLNYIKLFCNNKNVDFTLSFFKDKAKVEMTFNDSKYTKDMSVLYKENAEGAVLKNEEALKYLLETKSSTGDEVLKRAIYPGDNLFMCELFEFCQSSSYIKEYKAVGGTLPLEHLLTVSNDPTAKAFTDSELTYMKSVYGREFYFKFMRNLKGTWGYKDEGRTNADGSVEIFHGTITHLINLDGSFSENPYPGKINEYQFYKYNDGKTHIKGEPWKKLPYKENSNGVAAISKDQKTIYYNNGTETVDLLANDANKSSIASIYSFYIDDNLLIYTAVKTDGSYFTVSINIPENQVETLPVEEKIETVIKVDLNKIEE